MARWTGVPMTAIKEEEIAKLLRIEEELHKRIISQEKAISALARAIRRSRAGLEAERPPGGVVPVPGPTGVGKTEVARALASFLFGSEKSLVRFDMSEYMEKHSVSKLIGSPPGYVGYEEGGQLTERVKRNPYSIILLDEIEKAHPDIYNILLQVFEDGQLTDGLGNQVDFKNTIIIMTSNLGARFLEKRGNLGFSAPAGEGVSTKVEDMVRSEVKKAFNPEFLNRLDEVILFSSLTDDDLVQIIELMVGHINVNLVAKQVKIRLTPEAAKYILEKTCGDRSYGARPLRRALQKYIEDPLSEALIQGTLPRPAELEVYLGDTGIYYRQVNARRRSRRNRGRDRRNRSPARCCTRSDICVAGAGSKVCPPMTNKLEVEAYGCRDRARRHVVSSAERGEEVVKCLFVHQIHDRQARAPLALLAVKQIIVSHANIEQIALRDALRVVVRVRSAGSGNRNQRGTIQVSRAEAGRTDRSRGRRMHAAAVEPSFELLIGREVGDVHHGVGPTGSVGDSAPGAGHRAGHQPAVIAPVEADPRGVLHRLVLQVRGHIVKLVVIDPEYAKPHGSRAHTGELRAEKARRYAGRHGERRQPMEVGNRGAERISGDFRTGPFDRIGERRIP